MSNFIEQRLSEIKIKSNVKIKFFLHMINLALSIWGRFNFANMARFGKYSEKSYRNNFSKGFPFLDFNISVFKDLKASDLELVIAADASFLSKSGKHTYGKGHFWSGVSGKNLPGIEIHSLAAIDVENHNAYHLHTSQTPERYLASTIGIKMFSPLSSVRVLDINWSFLKNKNRVNFYIDHIVQNKEQLLNISKYIVYDGMAYKKSFVNGIKTACLELVSKARSDSDLRYFYTDEERATDREFKKRGPSNKYGKKINLKNPDLERFTKDYSDDEVTIYSAVVYSILLEQHIKAAYLVYTKTQKYVLLFSTDLNLSGEKIYKYYRARFSIEILFRDAKQYTGLNHSQTRDEHKMNYHFNISMTAVSLMKYEFYEKIKDRSRPFSMRNIKLRYYNILLTDYIFSNSDLEMTLEKKEKLYANIEQYGQLKSRTG